MRERLILFKGKSVNDGEWNEGYLFDDGLVDSKRLFIGNIVIINNEIVGRGFVEVIPETVGAYTGLTDKNGRKIFEGDIININDIELGHVIYEEPETQFEILFSNEIICYGLGSCHLSSELEVIGNIHDNPELLKGE